MMDFLLGGFGRFFAFFPGYDARACPAKLKTRLDSGLKTPPAAAPKAEDPARPGRFYGPPGLARLVRPGRFY